MKTNLKATGLDLSPALTVYVDDKLSLLDKLVETFDGTFVEVEIGKITKHHKTGQWFFAEANLHIKGQLLRYLAEATDLYAAIDKMKDGLAEEIRKYHRRRTSFLRRGERAIKRLFLRS